MIDERNIPPLDQRTINAIHNQFGTTLPTETNNNIDQILPKREESMEEKITENDGNTEENQVHKPK